MASMWANQFAYAISTLLIVGFGESKRMSLTLIYEIWCGKQKDDSVSWVVFSEATKSLCLVTYGFDVVHEKGSSHYICITYVMKFGWHSV